MNSNTIQHYMIMLLKLMKVVKVSTIPLFISKLTFLFSITLINLNSFRYDAELEKKFNILIMLILLVSIDTIWVIVTNQNLY